MRTKFSFQPQLLILGMLIVPGICQSKEQKLDFWSQGNWFASWYNAIQADTRFTKSARSSWVSQLDLAYQHQPADLKLHANVMYRSSALGFERGQQIYDLYLDKGIKHLNSHFKLGRFQRSDHLGFYFLDGIHWQYKSLPNAQKNIAPSQWGFDVYAGKPGRIDDFRMQKSDFLSGLAFFASHKLSPRLFKLSAEKNEKTIFALEQINWRFAWQHFKATDKSKDNNNQRLNFSIDSQGQLDLFSACQTRGFEYSKRRVTSRACRNFYTQIALSYSPQQNRLEDYLIDIRFPLLKRWSGRVFYEYYRPKRRDNPGFREQFFSYYSLGEQRLSELEIRYDASSRLSYFGQLIHSKKDKTNSGFGSYWGVDIKRPGGLDLDLSLAIDELSLGKNRLKSFYFSSKLYLNSRSKFVVDAIWRQEQKYAKGRNSLVGVSTRFNYLLKNNIDVGLSAKYIHHSKHRDEYQLNLNCRYYFDNYKTKQNRQGQLALNSKPDTRSNNILAHNKSMAGLL